MTFALITEGVSEYNVIKHLVSKYFKEQDPDCNPIQPKQTQGKQDGIGGWNEVLKYCQLDDLRNILIENDYLIIQIDSDQSETSPFDIAHTKIGSNEQKTPAELAEEIAAHLESLLLPDIRETLLHRIIFAVSVHTIECWLLPIVLTNSKKASKPNACLTELNKGLTMQNKPHIQKEKNSPQARSAYQALLRSIKNETDIQRLAESQASLACFVANLHQKTITYITEN